MDTDNVNNDINQFSKKKPQNLMDYLSSMFLNDNDNIYDDNYDNNKYEQAYKNIKNLSKMNWDEIQKHHNINIDKYDEYKDTSMYKKKYSNVIDKSFEYKIDYELKINDDEDIKFIKTKNK